MNQFVNPLDIAMMPTQKQPALARVEPRRISRNHGTMFYFRLCSLLIILTVMLIALGGILYISSVEYQLAHPAPPKCVHATLIFDQQGHLLHRDYSYTCEAAS